MQCTGKTKKGKQCRRRAVTGEPLCAAHLGTAHRPTKLDEKVSKAITDAIRAGNFQDIAARHAGISPKTFYEWMARGEAGEPHFADFRDSVTRARADAEVYAVAGIRLAMASADEGVGLKARTWFLERSFPQRWARRQVLEHQGKEGGPIEHQVDVADEETRRLGHALLERLSAAGGD